MLTGIATRKIVKQGGSLTVSLPKEISSKVNAGDVIQYQIKLLGVIVGDESYNSDGERVEGDERESVQVQGTDERCIQDS